MPGTPLEQFTMLMESTGPAWATDASTMVNDAVRNNYTLSRIRANADIEDMVSGGDYIEDRLLLEAPQTFRRVNPGVSDTAPNPQTGVNFRVPWTYALASIAWEEQELGHNIENMTNKYRAQVYKRVMRQKHQVLRTEVHNAIDDEFWAPPDFTNMESGAPSVRIPYSIPVGINEFQNGLPVGLGQTSWTSKQGINPATAGREKWQALVSNYSFDANPTTGADLPLASGGGIGGLFVAMSRMIHRLRFSRLPKNQEFSDMTSSPHVIFTQLEGLTNFEFALRATQDHFRGMGAQSGQDPHYDGPTFRGIPLEWIQALQDAAIYPTGTDNAALTAVAWSTWDDDTNVTNSATSGQNVVNVYGEEIEVGHPGPRYYFFNGEYACWFVHQSHYLDARPVVTPEDQPMSRKQYFTIWNNFYFKSLIRQGLLTPGAPIVNADAVAA